MSSHPNVQKIEDLIAETQQNPTLASHNLPKIKNLMAKMQQDIKDRDIETTLNEALNQAFTKKAQDSAFKDVDALLARLEQYRQAYPNKAVKEIAAASSSLEAQKKALHARKLDSSVDVSKEMAAVSASLLAMKKALKDGQ
ncbi:hypothetical protein LTR56_021007 [Elasticomyces elasticus]|nr:hypothetical protein LTR56_021007 [Elasticomyces elasticus]KAK3628851.1 hypothetical protein LTR22_022180 [Elasticomyces elasticus]KAK4909751.1 hypothetical protein LTR49_021484 [Elasticomyces elasticus]KAK5738643.1 hypothetical protein LTS12_025505 [Elasticomyces elasticus]